MVGWLKIATPRPGNANARGVFAATRMLTPSWCCLSFPDVNTPIENTHTHNNNNNNNNNTNNTTQVDRVYKDLKPVGKGSYGIVCSAVNSDTGENVAIKRVSPISAHVIDAKHVLREIRMMRCVRACVRACACVCVVLCGILACLPTCLLACVPSCTRAFLRAARRPPSAAPIAAWGSRLLPLAFSGA